jgi:hypothetical protein
VERHGLEVLNNGGDMELVACPGEASSSHPLETMVGLQMRKAHFDPASFDRAISRTLSSSSCGGLCREPTR